METKKKKLCIYGSICIICIILLALFICVDKVQSLNGEQSLIKNIDILYKARVYIGDYKSTPLNTYEKLKLYFTTPIFDGLFYDISNIYNEKTQIEIHDILLKGKDNLGEYLKLNRAPESDNLKITSEFAVYTNVFANYVMVEDNIIDFNSEYYKLYDEYNEMFTSCNIQSRVFVDELNVYGFTSKIHCKTQIKHSYTDRFGMRRKIEKVPNEKYFEGEKFYMELYDFERLSGEKYDGIFFDTAFVKFP